MLHPSPGAARLEFARSTKRAKALFLDDEMLVLNDQKLILSKLIEIPILNIVMHTGSNSISHWMLNATNYEPPELPILFAALA